jgi:GntR family transcriptional regulator, galactonate operon transcriptional repressor
LRKEQNYLQVGSFICEKLRRVKLMIERNKWYYPTQGIHGKVVHEIGQEIVSGAIKPGERIPDEVDILQRFQGSRTAIREALRVLTAKGLIEAKQRAGTRVREREYWNLLDPDIIAWQSYDPSDRNDFRNLVETRILIEPLVTRLVAQRATEEELDRLEDIYMSMQVADDEQSLAKFYPACVEFHITLYEICHNDLLSRLSGISQSLCDYHFRLKEAANEYVAGMSAMYHEIISLMRVRNAEAAEHVMQKLLDMKVNELKELHSNHQNTSSRKSDRIAIN